MLPGILQALSPNRTANPSLEEVTVDISFADEGHAISMKPEWLSDAEATEVACSIERAVHSTLRRCTISRIFVEFPKGPAGNLTEEAYTRFLAGRLFPELIRDKIVVPRPARDPELLWCRW